LKKPTDAIAAQSVGWLRESHKLVQRRLPMEKWNRTHAENSSPICRLEKLSKLSQHLNFARTKPNQGQKSPLTLVSSLNSRTKPLACGNVQHMYQAALFLCAYKSVARGAQAPGFSKGTVDCDISCRSYNF
jgi:hypothetical protein